MVNPQTFTQKHVRLPARYMYISVQYIHALDCAVVVVFFIRSLLFLQK